MIKGRQLPIGDISVPSKHDSSRHKNPNNRRPIRPVASVCDITHSTKELPRQAVRNQASVAAPAHARNRREATG